MDFCYLHNFCYLHTLIVISMSSLLSPQPHCYLHTLIVISTSSSLSLRLHCYHYCNHNSRSKSSLQTSWELRFWTVLETLFCSSVNSQYAVLACLFHSCISRFECERSYDLIYTNIHKYTAIYTNIHKYTQIYTNIHQYTPIYTNIHQY